MGESDHYQYPTDVNKYIHRRNMRFLFQCVGKVFEWVWAQHLRKHLTIIYLYPTRVKVKEAEGSLDSSRGIRWPT